MRGPALVLSLMPAAAFAQDLTVPHSPTPLAVVVNVPSGRPGRVARSDILREISDLLRQHTDFEMIDVDATLVRRCLGKLACMVVEVRPDFGGVQYPTHLLVATYLTHEKMTERLSLLLVDTERALRIHQEADRNVPDWEQEVEARLLSSNAMVPERSIDVARPSDAFGFIRDLMQGDFRAMFEESGHWHPFGTIELTSPQEGAVVMMEDVQLGLTRAGVTRISRVRARTHQLRVEASGFEPFVTEVVVKRDAITKVEATFAQAIDPSSSAIRQGVLWTGVAAAATGVAVVIYALAKPSELRGYCIHSEGAECEGSSSFARFGSPSGEAFETGNGSGPPIAPIGLGLLGLGATWSLGTWLFGEEDEIPWIQGLIGLGVLGLTLGLSLALDGEEPVAANR